MKRIVVILLLLTSIDVLAQKYLTLSNNDGMYTLKCKINNVPLNMIINPGAEKVVFSADMGSFLLQNGIVSKEDFSEINNELIVTIRELEISGTTIRNVQAIISSSYVGPPVLGQSAFAKMGRYSIKGNQLILYDVKTDRSYAIQYGNKWLDKKSLIDRIDRKAGAYMNYLRLEGDMRVDFVEWLNEIRQRLYDGRVSFGQNSSSSCLTNLGSIKLQCCYNYNNRGVRGRGNNYVDIRQHVINLVCGVAEALSQKSQTDINGVIFE